MTYPATIDNDWERLYREFPEVYDEFASFPYQPSVLQVVRERFGFTGQTVLDVGAGGGQSAIPLARYAAQVIGVERQAAMRNLAEKVVAEQGLNNVTFLDGDASAVPLPGGAVDIVMAITAPLDVEEALRVVRSPGLLLHVDVAPGWYGGELSRIIQHPTPELDTESERLMRQDRFSFEDIESVQEYGSTANILRTYGFIFGPRAIAHLRRTGQTSMRWRFRIHYRQI